MRLADMSTEPLGNEWSSIASYLMEHQPNAMLAIMEHIFSGDIAQLSAYFLGAAVILHLVEDNGRPSDTDEALHGWMEDEPFDLRRALAIALDNLERG